ncbi:glycosyl hydrolase [Arthrobacter agilis]|uniref:glycoside hydrolase family 26 protein n=1 Tax=Arthrobacter agilis TaxID=37921 RepID=UPI0023662EEA|nr:glycosyl hydrolase [Arthrobacter agilis]WDF33055.1 glycosyl hydrolase [Arthrobacter agilis]
MVSTLSRALVALLLLTLCACNINPAAVVCDPIDGRHLAPEDGTLMGVNLEWGKETLAEYTDKLGERPAVAVSFADFPFSDEDPELIAAAAEQVRQDGGILLLTLEPQQGLAPVTAERADDLAAMLARFNANGVPVIVRFAHEMNGSWYPWGQQPDAYIAAFRRVADAVHAQAPGSAMMWAPNYAGGYPFAGGTYESLPGTDGFEALDTTADGELTAADDPYAPYYPGDDVVDWVGMSLYHWGSTYPWGESEMPEDGKFIDQLTGTYNGKNGDDSMIPDFYADYAVGHGKPVAIPETAALVTDDIGDLRTINIKRAWWAQVFDPAVRERFPELRMVNWFEWNKVEPEVGAAVDWTVAEDPAVRDEFRAALPSWYRFAGEPATCGEPIT